MLTEGLQGFLREQEDVVVQADVHATVASWGRFRSFSKEQEALTAVPWAKMRTELHLVEDFVAKWTAEVQQISQSALQLALLREVASYSRCVQEACRSLAKY
jgi:hypothetical protein